MARIFINYRRQDTEGYVGRLYDHLTRHFPTENLFLDVDSIPLGADFVAFLDDAVAACDVLLAVIGPHWADLRDASGQPRIMLDDDFVRIEIASALRQGKTVIPVLMGDASMPRASDLPDDIAGLLRRNAFHVAHRRFAADVDQLADSIRAIHLALVKPPAPAPEIARKSEAIRALRARLAAAEDSPLYGVRSAGRYFPILGEGNPDAAILFIGESPGKIEAAEGRPFVGQSGIVLNELLAGISLSREDIFLTNLVLDYVGAKREPTEEEIAFYAPYLDALMAIIEPAVIVPLGRFAAKAVLKKFGLPESKLRISDIHGQLMSATASYGPIHIVPMYHPAMVLYSASWKDTFRQDFQKLRMFL